jgi:hypothetical protein
MEEMKISQGETLAERSFAPPERMILFTSNPGLRLPWAIIDGSLWEQSDRPLRFRFN